MSGVPVKVLITGFGHFPGMPDNPSERLIGRIGAGRQLPGLSDVLLQTALLPTEWDVVRARSGSLLAEHDPDVVLHCGVHAKANGFHLERWARNRTGALPDAGGRSPQAAQIVSGGPRALRTTGPAERLVRQLRGRGLPARISIDAGRYLCNMLFYLSLLQAHRSGRPHVVQFVHIPRLAAPGGPREKGTLTMAQLETGTATLIAHCVAHVAGRRHASAPARNAETVD